MVYINLAQVSSSLSSLHYFPFPTYQNAFSFGIMDPPSSLLSKNEVAHHCVFLLCICRQLPTLLRRLSTLENPGKDHWMTPPSSTSSKTTTPSLDVRRSSRLSTNYDYHANPDLELPNQRYKSDIMRSSSTCSKIRLQLIYGWFSSCLSSTTRISQKDGGIRDGAFGGNFSKIHSRLLS